MKTSIWKCLPVILLIPFLASAQANWPITVSWPSIEKATLKITFAKLQKSGVVNGQGIFVCEVTAQNVTEQGMPHSVFTVFIADKNGVRIGRARLQLAEVPPYRTEKAQLQFSAVGEPAAISLLAGKTIPLKVVSVPPGAAFKVDGADEGVTPKVVDFTIGSHTLEFSKEGYADGSTPLDVGADELPGGSVSFELGGLSQDTVELRDGSTVLGDVISMSLTQLIVRVDGKDQKYDRNQVKKVILVERIVEQKAPAEPATPATQK
ncbi:MAG TPA: PEGA domain-containing protein [Candidatus Sulfotelmatobacter sp.]|nr:PEGA domain-containing protein [Candidatus Sulfotelmatobacter sp.]